MADMVMPSTKMLPMDDVAEVLKVKYNFSSKEDIAKRHQQGRRDGLRTDRHRCNR